MPQSRSRIKRKKLSRGIEFLVQLTEKSLNARRQRRRLYILAFALIPVVTFFQAPEQRSGLRGVLDHIL